MLLSFPSPSIIQRTGENCQKGSLPSDQPPLKNSFSNASCKPGHKWLSTRNKALGVIAFVVGSTLFGINHLKSTEPNHTNVIKQHLFKKAQSLQMKNDLSNFSLPAAFKASIPLIEQNGFYSVYFQDNCPALISAVQAAKEKQFVNMAEIFDLSNQQTTEATKDTFFNLLADCLVTAKAPSFLIAEALNEVSDKNDDSYIVISKWTKYLHPQDINMDQALNIAQQLSNPKSRSNAITLLKTKRASR